MQLCPLLLQPDPLLHDQPHPAVGLVHAKTHKTTTGQDEADRGGGDDGGNEESIFPNLEFVFTQTQKQTQVISMLTVLIVFVGTKKKMPEIDTH